MSISVMIVDDSCAMRAVIKKVITISGFKISTCLEAANGREALEKLKQNYLDVIISGINMPEMNGLELLQFLSQDPLYQTFLRSSYRQKEAANGCKMPYQRGKRIR